MELTLKENYTILHIAAKKGLVNDGDTAFTIGLAAIVLAELMQRKKIALKGEYVLMKDAMHTGDAVLDFVLDQLDSSDNDYNVRAWLERLTHKETGKNLLKALFGSMEKNNLVKFTVRRKFLILGKEQTYQLNNPSLKTELEDKLRKCLLVKNTTVTENDAILIILLDRCRLFKLFLSDANDRRSAGKRVKELMAIPISGDNLLFKALQVELKDKYTIKA
ncbi:MAG: GPP34 family phosphoprotein [Bacteroidetes bacterium]|nr:GPP34 family phosphoprotein [Bacteroidota bacterium]